MESKVLLRLDLIDVQEFVLAHSWVPKFVIDVLDKEFCHFLLFMNDGSRSMPLVLWN